MMLMMRKNKDELALPDGFDPKDRRISISEVAAIVGVGIDTIRRLRAKGELPPAKKVGSALRWKLRDIIAWNDARD
jgi:excisionase family DNA binding protein